MPRCFVSNGLEVQMPNETFDLLWNSFPNAELTDTETSSSFGEGDKVTSSVENQKVLDRESRTTDTTITSPTTAMTSKSITNKKRSRAVYATYAVL